MCCTTLVMRGTAMATRQLTRVACYEICRPRQEQEKTEYRSLLHMNWVVASDENGRPQLRMSWRAEAVGRADEAEKMEGRGSM